MFEVKNVAVFFEWGIVWKLLKTRAQSAPPQRHLDSFHIWNSRKTPFGGRKIEFTFNTWPARSSFPVLLSKEQCNHRSSTVGSFLFFPSEVSLFSFGVVNEIPTPHGPCCWWCWFCLTIHLFASFSVGSKWFYTSSAICPMTHAFQGFPTALVHDQLTSTQVLQHLCHFRTIVLINSMTWAPIVAIAATFLLSFPFPFPC